MLTVALQALDTDDLEGCEFSSKFRAETIRDMGKLIASVLRPSVGGGLVVFAFHDVPSRRKHLGLFQPVAKIPYGTKSEIIYALFNMCI